ncbi:MAG: M3 family oligoendopeptidase [bacterium]
MRTDNSAWRYGSVLIILFSLSFTTVWAVDRHDAAERCTWNLGDLYAGEAEWETALNELGAMVDTLASYKGRLSESPEVLAEYFRLTEEYLVKRERVGSYAYLGQSISTHDQNVLAMVQRVQTHSARYYRETSWDNSEMLAIPKETLLSWIENTPSLQPYRFTLLRLIRNDEHVLDEEGEHLMALAGPALGAVGAAYGQLTSQDMDFPEIVLTNGDTITANYANFNKIAATSVASDREAMFKGYYWSFREYQNTFASLFLGMLRSTYFRAQARDYQSTREMRYFPNAKPVEIQDQLLEIARTRNAPLKRYHELRKKILGLDSYRYCDIVAPLVDRGLSIPFDSAFGILIDALEPFGGEFAENARRAYKERWVDAYPADDKYFNAFCGGPYDTHPYVLINYSDDLESLSTLSHEMGHAVHAVLTNETQNYYNTFADAIISETASTMFEEIVQNELMKRVKTPEERIAILQLRIDELASLFYRQSILGDFELKAHRAQAEGKPITANTLNQFFVESLTDVYGNVLDDPEWADVFWATKPHFYSPYYVTDYTFSRVSSAALYKLMTEGSKKKREQARQRYIELLKSGGSDYPIDQLKRAGVDLTTPDPYLALVAELDDLVTQLEKELKAAKML